ncbi:MAG: DNA-binding transcriptional LysR family regulator [Psychrosphaera sp.]|jgi:DNA-binding transcriptional LysR family regulator|uniref:LysR family transcriptional regulator n=1 Tax=Psychrosphaera sp. F3M07 TaxID=2841560 RepID=UPI001C0A2338|nr:LysR family transcriptional regulator [Psychrosphaera sp. F3M07]MBU2916356.1 LysR family transcriptional regulator [Psychrosphaera sp. F3M07]
MNNQLLRTFLEVSETLHFRIAGENLSLTQSAVSARIKQLEVELSVSLFDRTHKQLKLTAEGHRLIKHANDMLDMWQKTKQDISMAKQDSSQLVIGAMMSIWDIALHAWMQKIHRNIEDVGLYTRIYNPLELRSDVLNRKVDIGFLFEPPIVDLLVSRRVASIPLHLVTTSKLSLTSQRYPNIVNVDYGESINEEYRKFFGGKNLAKHHMSQPNITLDYILEAGGSAYLPKPMTFPLIQQKQLFEVESAPVFYRDIYAIYLAKGQKQELIEQTLDLFPVIKAGQA